MKDIHQRLLATFQIEHRDHVEQIRSLLAMIQQTARPAGAELDEIFRRAHSLKGAARAVDLHQVEELAHRLETLFSRVRQGGMPMDKQVTGVVEQVLDASEDCMAALGENRSPLDAKTALRAIEGLLGMEPVPGETPAQVRSEEAPAPAQVFESIETVRVPARNFDGLLRSTGGVLAEGARQKRVTGQLSSIARQAADLESEGDHLHRTAASSLRRLNALPEFSSVTRYLASAERQVRALSQRTREARLVQQRSAWATLHLGRQLQRDVWQARMAPAQSLLEGCGKLVRDLARDQSKEIEFRATSSGVQADRRVLQALADPIRHLLRNAATHGIETPKERAKKGKSPAGVVALRVDSQGPHLTVTVEDDGCGVDVGGVARVAIQQGILPAGEAARRPSHELARMIFRPGFSTATGVTNLSGRGMGLSVVEEAAKRLQGEVALQSSDGGGTSIVISVPLSVSTHRLLLVACGGQPFAIPLHFIERLHRLELQNVRTVENRASISLNGEHIPLMGLSQLLDLKRPAASPQIEVLRVVIVRFTGRRAAIAVDAFLSDAEAVIHDLGPAAPADDRISGAILLEDGAVALVLNPVELLAASDRAQTPAFFKRENPAPERAPSSILVVDDSMTTRTLEKNILEAHGYKVRVAVDGIEALAELRAEKPDLVITDVQMPRLDGFGLLEALKRDPNLNSIPVIVVTSLGSRDDQERGLALGADAYIVKRKFDQGELLDVIRQIL